jgi:flavin-dependent dehydrogenase
VIDADVIVVGAGPAGCVAAAAAGRCGMRVVIVESQPVAVNVPGETLHPGIEPPLQSVGAGWVPHSTAGIRHDGIRLRWPESPAMTSLYGEDHRGPWLGFQVRRADFHEQLLEHATTCGAQVIRPCKGIKPLVADRRVIGVDTSKGTLTAHCVIDASGSRHWLARRLSLPISHYSPRLVARYGYRKGAADERRPIFTADGCGWSWTAQIDQDHLAWVRLRLNSEPATPPTCPPDIAHLPAVGKTGGADVTWRGVTPPSGSGFFIIGDAAFVIDPAASHGVLRAVLSGLLAARLTCDIKADNKAEPPAHAAYQEWMARHRATDTAALRELYAKLTPRPDWL